jgi:hypothetical protein
MKNIFTIIITLIFAGCTQEPPKKYKHVISITSETRTYPVTITKYSGGNTVQRGTGGAIIGGGIDLILGGTGTKGAIIGGLIGSATTEDPKSESYTEIRTDITYTVLFNDSTIDIRKNYCPFVVGDSIRVY